MSLRQRQRGVALIMAMLIVALAVILATQIGFDSALEQQRTATTLTMEQAFQVGIGAEAWAAKYLQDDARSDQNKTPPQDHPAEDWARPMPPIPIDGGQIEGGLEDLQGRFNLNNLADDPDKRWRRTFQHLLTALDLEPKWADILADWIDSDVDANFPDGAEDSAYLSMTPPYRTANMVISSVSELLALPEFGLERYRKLKPYVTALPVGTHVNVCTASGILIDALTEGGEQEHALSDDSMARARKDACFPRVETLKLNHKEMDGMIDEQSNYFRLSAFVTIGGTEFSLYSLLYRPTGPNVRIRTVMRSFGAE